MTVWTVLFLSAVFAMDTRPKLFKHSHSPHAHDDGFRQIHGADSVASMQNLRMFAEEAQNVPLKTEQMDKAYEAAKKVDLDDYCQGTRPVSEAYKPMVKNQKLTLKLLK